VFGKLLEVIFAYGNTTKVDDVCVGLTLMYGYATSYASSTTIVETLVVNMFIPHIVFYCLSYVVATMVSLNIIFVRTHLSTILRGNSLLWFQMNRHYKSKGIEEKAIHYWVFAKTF
jgi:hypothetical protein